MASEEFLIDKLLVGAIDDLCRLIDLAKHRQGAKIIRERTGHLIMLGKNWTELWRWSKAPMERDMGWMTVYHDDGRIEHSDDPDPLADDGERCGYLR